MRLSVVVLLATIVSPTSGSDTDRAVAAPVTTYLQPYVWGGAQTGTAAYGAYGSPTIGLNPLSTTSPSGGGNIGPRTTDTGPESKMQYLTAFGGGTPLFFAKGNSASGTTHMLAAVRNASTNAHELWGWGSNTYGQVGKGDTLSFAVPLKSPWIPESGEQILELAVGDLHSLMLTSDGTTRRVCSWGINNYGQLGISTLAVSTSTRQSTPRLISALTSEGVMSIAAGKYHSVAVGSDGYAWVWGADLDTYGNLGLPGQKARSAPIKLTNQTINQRTATVVSYSIAGGTTNKATLVTSGNHYFEVGDSVDVNIGHWLLDGTKTITAVTNTSFTFQAQPSVSTTAVSPVGTIAHTAGTVTPTRKVLVSNEATLTIPSGHNFRTGNVITVSIGDTAFDGQRTITGYSGTSVSFTSQPNESSSSTSGSLIVTSPTSSSVTNRVLTSGTAVTLTVPANHGFKAGNKVTVALSGSDPSAASFNGDWTLTSVSTTSVSYTVPSRTSVTSGATTGTISLTTQSYSVTAKQISGNAATITIPVGQGLATGNVVEVSGLGGTYDGVKTLTAYNPSAGTIGYKAQADIASTAVATGTLSMVNPSRTVVSKAVNTGNLATLTLGVAAHGFVAGNSVTISGVGDNFDGAKSITAVNTSTGTVNFYAQENVSSQTLGTPGSATVTTCSGSCPTAPTGLVEVAAGSGFTLARNSSGGVFSWGFTGTNHYGRLGRGQTPATSLPADVSLPSGCIAANLDVGDDFASVLCANSTVAVWGSNTEYKLGANVVTTQEWTPKTLAGITLASGETVAKVDLHRYGGIALTSTGKVWTWGWNAYRLLGNAKTYTTGSETVSAQRNSKVALLASRVLPTNSGTVIKLFASHQMIGVLDSNGVVWTWGNPASGLSGRGNYGPTATPFLTFDRLGVPSGTRIVSMDSTYYGTVAVMSDNSVWSWGSLGATGGYYYNGDGGATSAMLPMKLSMPFGYDSALPSVTPRQLSCGTRHCLLTTSNGSIYGWGDGSDVGGSTGKGGLTLNSYADVKYPTLLVSGLTNPKVAAGFGFSLYVDVGSSSTGGVAKGWGYNAHREASPASASTPLTSLTDVKDMSVPASPGTVTDIIDISAGTYHAVALRADGSLMTWGYNGKGQLGNGLTSGYYAEPTLPGGRTGAAVYAAGYSTFVRATDGTLWSWGYNGNGFLGNGNTTDVLTPTRAATGYTFTRLAFHGYATARDLSTAVGLTTSGGVVTWGSNRYGQLGHNGRPASASGANANSSTPVQVRTYGGEDVLEMDAVATGGWWSGAYSLAALGSVPSAPRTVAMTSPASGQLQISWVAPLTPNALTGYEIVISRGATEVFRTGAGASSTSLTLSAPTFDIQNGQAHTVVMYAVNEWGKSVASNSASATPTATPDAVRNLKALPLVSGIRVTFDEPLSDGGSAITSFSVAAVPTSGSTVNTTVSPGGPNYSVDLSGVAAGMSYTVTVTPNNAVGPGTPASSNVVVPGRPSAPQSVAAVGLIGEMNITWTSPESDGGTSIQSYVVEVLSDGGGSSITSTTVNASTFSATIGSLVNGTAYDVRVFASHDATGATLRGPWSDTVDVTVGRPAKVLEVSAAPAGAGQVTVTWNKVADVAGLAIGGYDVDVTLSATTNVSAIGVGACGASTCSATIGSLTNGSTYTFKVAAKSSGNRGPVSDAVTATPRRAPDAPTSLEGSVADNEATVQFVAPAFDGGSAITGYVVNLVRYSTGATVYTTVLDAAVTSFTVSDLLNGVRYDANIQTRNIAGDSSAATVSVTPATTPGAPQNLTVAPGSIVVTWSAPSSDGGSAVTHYQITVRDSDGISTSFSTATSNPTGTSSCTTASRACTITQVYTADSPETLTTMPTNMSYDVTVAAVNAQGSGAEADTRLVVTNQPSEPTNVQAQGGYELIELCWTAPATVTGGGSVTAYQVTASTASGSRYDKTVDIGSLVNPSWCSSPSIGMTVASWGDGTGVVGGVEHDVVVQASQSVSDFIFGMTSTAVQVTPYTLPGTTSISTISTTSTSATVTWSAAPPNGSAVLEYLLTAQPGGAICTWTTGARDCVFDSLTGNQTYSFTVQARNGAGWGPVSDAMSATIDATPLLPTWSSPHVGDPSDPQNAVSEALVNQQVSYLISWDEVVSGFDVSDLRNVGTATGCTFAVSAVSSVRSRVNVTCTGTGTVIAQVPSGSVSDPAGNLSPLNNVNAALVTIKEAAVVNVTAAPPTSTTSSTTTTSTAPPIREPAAAAPTTTTQLVTTTSTLPPLRKSAATSPTTLPQQAINPGDTIDLDEDGFKPGEEVSIAIGDLVLDTVEANKSGQVVATVEVPAGVSTNSVLTLKGLESGRTIRKQLVATGVNSWPNVLLAAALLVIGVVFTLTRRRMPMN